MITPRNIQFNNYGHIGTATLPNNIFPGQAKT